MEVLSEYKFSVVFENMEADVGYISEKILDSFFAGVVPIYLGDAGITERIAPESFVDARRFRSDRGLLKFVQGCSEAQWWSMRDAGRKFLASSAMADFRPQAFAEKVISVVKKVVGNPRS